MQKRMLFKMHRSLTLLTLKRLLLAISMGCLVATVNAAPMDDASAAYRKGDYAQALKIFKSLATQGNASAQYIIGFMYVEGKGVIQDYEEAAKWYRLAADQGNALAQNDIGVMYVKGKGVIQDYKEAVKWYRLSAAKGFQLAQRNIGEMYENGKGVTQDYILAHMWFNLSSLADVVTDGAKNRDLLAKKMTPQQIEKAQDMARECQARNFKGC